jgi:hypothetical protein
MCVQGLAIYLTLLEEALHKVVCVLKLKKGRYSDLEVFLLRTGLTGG